MVDDLREKIERRKELQKKEKELSLLLPKPKEEKRMEKTYAFKTVLLCGESLRRFVNPVVKYKKRSLYRNLSDYVYGDNDDKVLILYGLRRTGKTTLIRQVISEMKEDAFSKTALDDLDRRCCYHHQVASL